MLEKYKTIYEGGEGEIVEKKSRFIATVQPVESEEQAIAFVESIKKKYWDARHNCSAYVIGQKREVMRCSDDGEPSQTAGKPMLDVLIGQDLYNTAVVVTRYFGGTLLGTGGLVRAYSAATLEGIKNSKIIEKCYGVILEIFTDYTGIGKIQYLLGQNDIPILDSLYTDIVVIQALVPILEVERIRKSIIEVLNGKVEIKEVKKTYFAEIDKKYVLM